MPQVLLEVGCEELPPTSVDRACERLAAEVVAGLQGVSCGEIRTYATPRRLIVAIDDVETQQADSVDERRGPSESVAFQDGQPSKALQGFCRKNGVDPQEVEVIDGYVVVKVEVPGRTTVDLLAEAIPQAIRAIPFDKTMRWGSGRLRFARPIRWIVATFDGQAVPFEFEGVPVGHVSYGHRFEAPGAFEATTLQQLFDGLRERCVEPDPAVRHKRIVEGAKAVSDGVAISESLLMENVQLTEWPNALEGSFDERFLALPEPVLVTAMAKHERFFPVRDADGKLTNRFVSIRNGGVEEVVREGNAWVLNARLNDALFFYEQDQKLRLDDFLAKTERMVYQEKLGTVRQRADRLAGLSAKVAEAIGADPERARLAGLYAKADLTTGLVGELASLQGIVGGLYAERDGLPIDVAQAISVQYDVKEVESGVDAALFIADRLDKLAGYLGIGLVPSGSKDPYGLRRAAAELLVVSRRLGLPLDGYAELWSHAQAVQTADTDDATQVLSEILRARYDVFSEDQWPHDVLAAATTDPFHPLLVGRRLEAMGRAKERPTFVQAASRPINIVRSALEKGVVIEGDVSKMDSLEGEALLDAARSVSDRLDAAMPTEALDIAQELVAPIDAFFDSTMVMVEDEAVRGGRLAMLNEVAEVLLQIGDPTKLVME